MNKPQTPKQFIIANLDADILNEVREFNLDIPSRTLFLHEEITQEYSKEFTACFSILVKKSHKLPIILDVSCEGGEVYAGLAILDTIACSPVPVIAVIRGLCMSMATAIVSVCHKRIAYPHTQFMIHQIWGGLSSDRLNAMKIELKHTENLQAVLFDIYKKYTKITNNFVQKYIKHEDYFFDSKEALKLGLIDQIYGENK